MEVRAKGRFLRFSPRKGRDVARLIAGKDVETAQRVLAFTNKAAARTMRKLVDSALANARSHEGIDVDNLIVHRVLVDGGPTLKRFKARSMGRGARIRKRTCHITVVLSERTV